MSWAALATKSGLSPTNRAPHGFCCSSKPSTSRPMWSDGGFEVFVADTLLVDALVMERFAWVLVMTGLLKSRRAGSAGFTCAIHQPKARRRNGAGAEAAKGGWLIRNSSRMAQS